MRLECFYVQIHMYFAKYFTGDVGARAVFMKPKGIFTYFHYFSISIFDPRSSGCVLAEWFLHVTMKA